MIVTIRAVLIISNNSSEPPLSPKSYSRPQKSEIGLRTISAGIPYTLLFRIEAIIFPTFGLLL